MNDNTAAFWLVVALFSLAIIAFVIELYWVCALLVLFVPITVWLVSKDSL